MATSRRSTPRNKPTKQQLEEVVEEVTNVYTEEEAIRLNRGGHSEAEANLGQQETAALKTKDVAIIGGCIIISLLCSLLTYIFMVGHYPELVSKTLDVQTTEVNRFVDVAEVHPEAECIVYRDGEVTTACEYYIKEKTLRALFTEPGDYMLLVVSPRYYDVDIYSGIIKVSDKSNPAPYVPDPTPEPTPDPAPKPNPSPDPNDPLSVFRNDVMLSIMSTVPPDTDRKESKVVGDNFIEIGTNAAAYKDLDELFSAVGQKNEAYLFPDDKKDYDPKWEARWYNFLGSNGALDQCINKYIEKTNDDSVTTMGNLFRIIGECLHQTSEGVK